MFTRMWFLYSIHYAKSKICEYKISHEEIVSPLDRDGNSSALSILSKLVRAARAARALLTVLRNKHKMQKHLATRCLAGSLVKTYCLKKYLLTSVDHVKFNSTCRQQFKCLFWKMFSPIHRGYYTVARRYEFYVRVATTISHE